MHVNPGSPTPLGPYSQKNGVNFALHAPQANTLSLLFYSSEFKLLHSISLDPQKHRTDSIWHVHLSSPPSPYYCYQINQQHYVVDPYAKEIFQNRPWGKPSPLFPHTQQPTTLGVLLPPNTFDWQQTNKPLHKAEDLLIYEMHLRGYTQHASSKTKHRGTYLGLIERIPHLLELGINAIELLPLFEFNELEYYLCDLSKKQTLLNYWGYSPIGFFTPMSRYASTQEPGKPTEEFKTMVRALHHHGIEVFLDVVYNHTGEMDRSGPIYSLKALDAPAYYHTEPNGSFRDYSGCGNTLNTNHPLTRQLIIDSLTYWVEEMGVDGFRFDLAAVFTRDEEGNPQKETPLLQAMQEVPSLKSAKLIAEPWDVTGLYSPSAFSQKNNNWYEWNGKYRDEVRLFMKGTPHHAPHFATRLCGSEDIFGMTCKETRSINFITCHDGFTLYDLVCYNQKHNLNNGENNRDGTNDNSSWNCGVEGETVDPEVRALRQRQMRNFILALMLSKGAPMLHMGDEYGHTKKGNNNTWCQDNTLNYFLWDALEKEPEHFTFLKRCTALRKSLPLITEKNFYAQKELQWHGEVPGEPNWHNMTNYVGMTLDDASTQRTLYIGFNMVNRPTSILLPPPPENRQWQWLLCTFEEMEGPLTADSIVLPRFTAFVLEALPPSKTPAT